MGDDQAKWRLFAQVAEVFTPGAPIDQFDLFAGRVEQIMDMINAVGQRGQHAVLYGERGVGKTSLASVLNGIFSSRGLARVQSVRTNCTSADNFQSIWRRLFRELDVEVPEDNLFSANYPGPEDVRYLLQRVDPRALIIIDELDRLEDDEALSLLADTVKTLSDNSVPSTLILVGVGDSIEQLVGDHLSVERALVQVQMPRMSLAQLMEIIDKGLDRLGMTSTAEARARIARLSEGLPHYTHSLSLHATQRAIADDRTEVRNGDVAEAIELAVQKAQHSIRSAYQQATRSPRKKHLFAEVLLACALAPKDDLGFFTASGVRAPLTKIMQSDYDIPAFARHLNEFIDDARGPVLQRTGQPRRYFYRFSNALLQPFVILNGLAKGLTTEEMIGEFQAQPAPSTPDDARSLATEQ